MIQLVDFLKLSRAEECVDMIEIANCLKLSKEERKILQKLRAG